MTCAHCDDLAEQVAFLKSELGLTHEASQLAALIDAFHLTPAEARILLTLYLAKGNIATRWTLLSALPRHSRKGEDDERSLNIVAVVVSRLRKNIGREAVENVWGLGVRLPASTVERVRVALDSSQAHNIQEDVENPAEGQCAVFLDDANRATSIT